MEIFLSYATILLVEKLSQIDASTEVAVRRAEIIKSILTTGLKSSDLLQKEGVPYFGSFDLASNNFISFRLIFPRHLYDTPKDFFSNLEHILYLRGISVLPVMAERQGGRFFQSNDHVRHAYGYSSSPMTMEKGEKTAIIKALEPRVSSSFIIVINETMEALIEKSRRFLFTSAKERFESLERLVQLKEKKILPDRFSYLIFPKALWDEYQNQGIKIGNDFQVRIAKRSVQRTLFEGKLQLAVPDYESAILEILKKRGEPIWVHGVRLPTEEDIKRL